MSRRYCIKWHEFKFFKPNKTIKWKNEIVMRCNFGLIIFKNKTIFELITKLINGRAFENYIDFEYMDLIVPHVAKSICQKIEQAIPEYFYISYYKFKD